MTARTAPDPDGQQHPPATLWVPRTVPSVPGWDSLFPDSSWGNGSGARSGSGTISSGDRLPALPDLRPAVRLAGPAAAVRRCPGDGEMLVLRDQIAVRRRRVRSPRLWWAGRAVIAALTRRLPAARRRHLALTVTPRALALARRPGPPPLELSAAGARTAARRAGDPAALRWSWPAATRPGATGGSAASWRAPAIRSRPPPSGRSARPPEPGPGAATRGGQLEAVPARPG
jgi:hypothetical protein